MALYKIDEYYPKYKEVFGGYDIKKFDFYAQGEDKVGSVKNLMVDESEGRFQYFIVDTGFWFLGKNVLLPVALASVDFDDKRVYVPSLTKQQVEHLPEFTEDLAIDNDYEELVRGVYRPSLVAPTTSFAYDPATYTYQQEPYFYNLNDQNLRTYEEQLTAGDYRNRKNII